MLELAVLGLLLEAPMHGYELRKQLIAKLGAFRAAISYGSLYPTLRRLQEHGFLTETTPDAATEAADIPVMTSRRGRVVYAITAEGKERFGEMLAQAGPETFDDPAFGVHFAFFSRTDRQTRLRILEGRRRRIEERREGLRDVLARAAERLDAYTLELQRHGLEAAEREVRCLEELIATERSGRTPGGSPEFPAPGASQRAPASEERTLGAGTNGIPTSETPERSV